MLLNDFAIVEETELEAEEAHLEAGVVCDLQTACFLLLCPCGLISWRDPLTTEISGGHVCADPSCSAGVCQQFWGLQNIYLSSSLHPSPSFLLALVPTTPRRASGPALLSLALSMSLFPSLCLFQACWCLSTYLIGFRMGKLSVPGVVQD